MQKQYFTAKDKGVVKNNCIEWKLGETSEEDPNRMGSFASYFFSVFPKGNLEIVIAFPDFYYF